MEAGSDNFPLLDNAPEAVMSEAWRVFLQSRYRVDGRLACRGTHNLQIENCPGAVCLLHYGAVAVQRIQNLSCVQKATCKNRDEFFNFIVRVSLSDFIFAG